MKINKKRLLWALREELYIVLVVIIIVALLAIPWVFIFLTDSFWWILLYPAAFFVIGVWEKYNGR
jgi:TctA family transporter